MCSEVDCDRKVEAKGLCHRHYLREWRQGRAEHVRAQERAYRAANPEVIVAARRRHYEKTREAQKERSRSRRAAHPERVAAYNREYARAHRPEINAKTRTRYAEDPTSAKAAMAARRARKAGAPVNDLTKQGWADILVQYEAECFYCGASGIPLTQDHKIPLSRGGSHTRDNVVPACVSCNSRKRAMTDIEFMAVRAERQN